MQNVLENFQKFSHFGEGVCQIIRGKKRLIVFFLIYISFFLRGKGRWSVICINFDILSSRGDFGQFSWNNMHFGKTLIIKLFFFFFTFSCFPSRWQNVKLSVLSEIASLEIILLSVAIVNMSTQTPFKRIISMCYGSWHHFVISLVLPALYLMLRYTAAPFFTTTWSMTTTMTQIQGQCHNIPRRIRF